ARGGVDAVVGYESYPAAAAPPYFVLLRPTPRKPPLSAAVLRAIFNKPSSSGTAAGVGNSRWVRPGLFPELRRTKSFSATKNEGFSAAFEPQRRSCDVRVRNTLPSLCNEDNGRNSQTKSGETSGCTDGAGSSGEVEAERGNSSVRSLVFDEKTESGAEHEEQDDYCGNLNEPRDSIKILGGEEEQAGKAREGKTKQVKEHMEFNSEKKKPNREFKEITGTFWSAASVFGKKLQKWRQKQKLKKDSNGRRGGSAALSVEKPIGKQLRDTQSEISDHGYGRRSCDTDPRFSLDARRISVDAGRVSVDDHRYSFDEPRASWDGYLIGRVTAPPRMPSMLSVVEDSPVRNHVIRPDAQIPAEEPPEMDENAPGGTAQTQEYYSVSSSMRRKSIDRSSSIRKTVVPEVDEVKPISNAKVSPFQDRELKGLYSRSLSHPHSHSQSNSLIDDCSAENFDENADDTKAGRRSRRWRWNIFGIIHRKNEKKHKEEEEEGEQFGSRGRRTLTERTLSGSWNVETRKGFDPRMMRSNSSVSWRNSENIARGGGGRGWFGRSNVDGYINGKIATSGMKLQ
ncbi:PREDICTED: UPF0503 protein At3g09070, chloroplastic-like, partial [Tarenaya hassleriana]|uniref:UPF0503 protein At3g09070, chloroplastic-like n=1 Tax=Tarenaya hassleriana TaxID=28532 RepID=UPI0008FD8170